LGHTGTDQSDRNQMAASSAEHESSSWYLWDYRRFAPLAGTIFREKVSGARADRPQLAKLMAGLKTGDVVAITKLDRLGRSTRELLDLIDRIGKAGALSFAWRSALGHVISARPAAIDVTGLHR
jgi:DNA invertase Pin-like site-specific DNA recombinase